MPAFVTMNFILCNNSFEMRCIRFNNLLKYVNKMYLIHTIFSAFHFENEDFQYGIHFSLTPKQLVLTLNFQ